MAYQIDINSYRKYFDGGLKQYNFYALIQFPDFNNALMAGFQGSIKDTSVSLAQSITNGLVGAAQTGANVIGLDNNVKVRPFYVRSTTLPSSTLNETISNWVGQEYKVAGNYTYSDWTVSFNIDRNANIIKDFYEWQKIALNPRTNKSNKPISYMKNQEIYLIKNGEPVCVYELISAWPKIINEVTLDYSSNDMLQFDVTFSYQYHLVSDDKNNVSTIIKTAVNSLLKTNI